jgi:hypothetical protein
VSSQDQGVPLLPRKVIDMGPPVGGLVSAGPAEGVGAGIPGVVQDVQGVVVVQRSPHQFVFARAASHAPREEQVLLAEDAHGPVGGAGAPEGLEEEADRPLHLRVRVEHHAAVLVVNETHGQEEPELAAGGLAQDAAFESRLQHVQLSLAHGPFETQKEAIVEGSRVVKAVFIQYESSREGADLKQPVPV